MGSCYIPRPYRPRLFPRLVRWGLFAVGCIAAVQFLVLLSWVADALYHG
jgi:hypothetical protein